jgi:2'-5' RNA ligase
MAEAIPTTIPGTTVSSATPSTAPGARMRDHWWWRPGWSVGRSFLAWHLTFPGDRDVARLARAYQGHLHLPGLDPIPGRWLHLTLQGVGFRDEIADADVELLVAAARARLTRLEPFTLALGPAVVDPEVVRLQVHPAATVGQLRRQLRAAIGDVRGRDGVLEEEDAFTPHVSLAYSNGDAEMAPVVDALRALAPEPARALIGRVDLIALNRDHRQYEWSTHAQVLLGAATAPDARK